SHIALPLKTLVILLLLLSLLQILRSQLLLPWIRQRYFLGILLLELESILSLSRT
ncbi:hypothetical protein PM10SUCC1_07770, partial [Propionigenium maris DSM 9537]